MRKFLLKVDGMGRTPWMNILYLLGVPLLSVFTMEWLHRGSLIGEFWSNYFFPHFQSFFLAWLLLVFIYGCICCAFRSHWVATLLLGMVCNGAGLICYYKLSMRGEPFLPWDFSQIQELAGVASNVKLQIKPFMGWALAVFVLVFVLSFFVHLPYRKKTAVKQRLCVSLVAAVFSVAMVCGVFMQPAVFHFFGIYEDMWMQDRYYRNYGVVTGFLTNLAVLKIEDPKEYSEKAVQEILSDIETTSKTQAPLYPNSYAQTEQATVESPNIIFLMNESFWDVSRLENIEFDREVTPNLTRLKEEAASGYCFSPSYGGGTCDVEFEVLTGFSIEHLPAGCKPYQQHVTQDMFSLPQYLRSEGYETMAVHGYYRKFWSRNVAYPYLGLDTFIAAEDFVNPHKRRGFISDAAMTQRIIEEYENRASNKPLFMHAITMQNHTTYDEKKYPADELVDIVQAPVGLSKATLSQLRDFATGIYEADAALGELVEYLRTVDEPTIVVFWGDHFNPIGNGNELYEATGYIEKGDTASPNLRKTDLLIWSNYNSAKIDLGTLASYNISPVMMELYGLEKPLYFSYLLHQLPLLRARTHGVTVEPDGSFQEALSEAQQAAFDTQWMLQYDLMFGQPFQQDYTPKEN